VELLANVKKFAFAGASAGACRAFSRGLTFPFDTMKTFEQSSVDTIEHAYGKKKRKRKINYFSGLITTIISAVPSNALFFITYNCILIYAPCLVPFPASFSTSSKLLERLIASAIATFPQNLIKIPAELVKQRAQLTQSSDIPKIVADAVKDKGISGLYVGGNAQLLREIPYNAFQMAFFDMFRDMAARYHLVT